MIGALIDGRSVCEGLSLAFAYIMSVFGVPCSTVFGVIVNGESHAWNVIMLEGKWYNVDVTHDLPVRFFSNRRWYVNWPDSFFIGKRKWESPIKCNSLDMNYYSLNGTMFKEIEQIFPFIDSSLKKKKKIINLCVWPSPGDDKI